MVYQVYLPRVRTVFGVVTILLFCTFSWDLIVLHRLYNLRQGHTNLKHHQGKNSSIVWSWRCIVGQDFTMTCERFILRKDSNGSMSFATCTMTCSPSSRIWPLPTGIIKIGNTSSSFHPNQLQINFTAVEDQDMSSILKNMAHLFKRRISNLSAKSHTHTSVASLVVTIQIGKSSKNYKYKLNIDESYKLIVKQKASALIVNVMAATFLGSHHGLETLSQLIWWDDRQQVLKILNNVIITDSPLFSYRGLLLDTARHFIPIPSILRTIDAMSMNKLNVFHWRMTDSMSFPFASEKYPGFKKFGSYSNNAIYSKLDIKHVVEYSFIRGVTVMVEIGAISHAGQGWDWGVEENKGNLTLCLGNEPYTQFCSEPPCGQLNPGNENSSLVLAGLLTEINHITKADHLMHIGGDDVDFKCWESMEEVIDMPIYLENGVSGVWTMFYKSLLQKISHETKTNPNFMMWSNDLLDDAKFWKTRFHQTPIIQSRGPSNSDELEMLINKKFQVIVSPSDVWSLGDPKTLLSVYHHRPWADLKPGDRKLVVGGEACAWTDHLDLHALDPVLWPATSTVAERLWSDLVQEDHTVDRLAWFRERMVKLGVSSSPVGPQWCLHNPSQCL